MISFERTTRPSDPKKYFVAIQILIWAQVKGTKDDENEQRIVKVKYVVGCDGAESVIREKLFFDRKKKTAVSEGTSSSDDDGARWLSFDSEDKDLDLITVDVKVIRDGVWKDRLYPEVTGYVETAMEPAFPVAYNVLPGSRLRFTSFVAGNQTAASPRSILGNLMGATKEDAVPQTTTAEQEGPGQQVQVPRGTVRELLKRESLALDVDVSLEKATDSAGIKLAFHDLFYFKITVL